MPLEEHYDDKANNADFVWHGMHPKTTTITKSINIREKDTRVTRKGAVDNTCHIDVNDKKGKREKKKQALLEVIKDGILAYTSNKIIAITEEATKIIVLSPRSRRCQRQKGDICPE